MRHIHQSNGRELKNREPEHLIENIFILV